LEEVGSFVLVADNPVMEGMVPENLSRAVVAEAQACA